MEKETEQNAIINKLDPLFVEAAHLVVTTKNCSVDTIQQKFAIGTRRTYRIISQLENLGIIEYKKDKNSWKVLICKTKKLDNYLKEPTVASPSKPHITVIETPQEESSLLTADPLLTEAAHILVESKNFSFSHLQRKLSIGYNRVQLLIKQLENIGVITTDTERKILFSDTHTLDNHLKTLGKKL